MARFVANPQIHGHTVKTVGMICLMFLLYHQTFAQQRIETDSNSPKISALFKQAQFFLQVGKRLEAIETLQKVLVIDPKSAEACIKMGLVYEFGGQKDEAVRQYLRSIELQPDAPQTLPSYHKTGDYYFKLGQYEKALPYFEKTVAKTSFSTSIHKRAKAQILNCKFALESIQKPLVLNSIPLSSPFNGFPSQAFPVLTADNETLFFTQNDGNENIFFSTQKDSVWREPTSISDTINTPQNEGTCSISADGRTLVFAACSRPDSRGGCDLYIVRKVGGSWGVPQNMGDAVNSYDWDSQPALSADGRTLYFSSERGGGSGKADIWVSKTLLNGQWGRPVNAGKTINSAGDDKSPFIHANGRTLFFATDGLVGMGGMDLFYAENQSDTAWSKPVNLGYPINTQEDQVSLFISADCQKGYYALDQRNNPQLRQEAFVDNKNAMKVVLFSFDLPAEIKAKCHQTNYLKGTVYDAQTKQKLLADIELIDLKTNQTKAIISSDAQTGAYLAVLNNGSKYALYVNKAGYFFKSLSFDYSEKNQTDGLLLDIALTPLQKNSRDILSNLFFDSGQYALSEDSKTELEKLAKFLKTNALLRVEISGHTDDVGNEKENLLLSQRRAKAVVTYLQLLGVETTRIVAAGYGKTKPIVANANEENRRQNRRIEWRVL